MEARPLRVPSANGISNGNGFTPLEQTIEQDLSEDVNQAKALQRELLGSVDMAQYAIDPQADFSSAEAQVQAIANAGEGDRARLSTTVSIKGAAPDLSAVNGSSEKKEKRKDKSGEAGKKHKKPRRD